MAPCRVRERAPPPIGGSASSKTRFAAPSVGRVEFRGGRAAEMLENGVMVLVAFVLVIALVGVLVLRQGREREVDGRRRMWIPILLGMVGLVQLVQHPFDAALGGGPLPDAVVGVAVLVLGVVVGGAYGVLTRIRTADDGRVVSRGTPATTALFLVLLAVALGIEFGFGRYASGQANGDLGVIMLVFAVAGVVQAEVLWRRARRFGVGAGTAR